MLHAKTELSIENGANAWYYIDTERETPNNKNEKEK